MPTRSAPRSQSTTFVALLRGVNVGGKNRLPMKEFAELLAEAGLAKVQTYIQSGNAIFTAPSAQAQELPGRISADIAERFGLKVPVVLRSADELAEVSRSSPFLAAGANPEACHVLFLAQEPGRERLAALDPKRSPPDELRVVGKEVYLYLPNGVARSKLTCDYFDGKLATTSTARNWRTVLKLLELCRAREAAANS